MRFKDFFTKKRVLFNFLLIILGLICSILIIEFIPYPNFIIISLIIIYCFVFFTPLLLEYFNKKLFYDDLQKKLNNLDKKYLITELIKKPNFIEGDILVDFLYDVNKSMIEEIKKYKIESEEFADYLEMWCHEIKTPIATSNLIIENNKTKETLNILEEINKINDDVEQVLYYAKSGNVNTDYIVKEINLEQIISNVIKRNKKDFINKRIKVEINCKNNVLSDSKWLEFIINQIIVNSIKYSKDDNNCKINITSCINKNNIILSIEDNGIGICDEDLEKVFIKGYTGINGRKKYNSTGMGLYLCKKLCTKLGHNIKIESLLNERTIVSIIFPINENINLTKM